MTLTRRLCLFFLTTLAVVLLGFSATLYVLAGNYLHRQAGDHLMSALDTLAVGVENGPGGLEWEPNQRLARPRRRHSHRVADS